MMKFSETIEINSQPQEIFTHYANVKDWSKWDSVASFAPTFSLRLRKDCMVCSL